jgi:hypothetical protein
VSRYDLNFNYDGVFLRSVIVGFLNVLHSNVTWKYQIGTSWDDTIDVTVPFYYGTAGQERYLQDNFLNDTITDPDNEKAEGPYNQVPRGVVNLVSVNVPTGDIVNKTIRTTVQRRQADGSLRAMSEETFWIPLDLQFDVTVKVPSLIDQLRCTERMLTSFYKNKPFRVDVVSTRIDCYASMPEAMEGERMMNFKFEDRKVYNVKCTMNVRTALPAYAPGSEIFSGNKIGSFERNLEMHSSSSTGATGLSSNVGATSLPRIVFPDRAGSTGPIKTPAWPAPGSGHLPPH